MRNENRTVYSTEWGEMCPRCGKPIADCICKQGKPPPAGDGIVRISRTTKGRGGKTVTLVSGVPLNEDELCLLLGELKRQCGAGGTLKDGVIEIQGDHRGTILQALKKRAFTVKLAGG
jgi:translation initiation factor 1